MDKIVKIKKELKSIQGNFNPDNKEAALNLLRKELEKLSEDKVLLSEFNKAKNNKCR